MKMFILQQEFATYVETTTHNTYKFSKHSVNKFFLLLQNMFTRMNNGWLGKD